MTTSHQASSHRARRFTAGIIGTGLALASLGANALEIALSNDDGWSAPGIQAMKQALIDAGHTVTLAAPLDEQSDSSMAVDANPGDLLITKQVDGANMEFSIATAASGGTRGAEPATSALMAIGLAGNPDLLITGINSVANIGSFTQISGTVGAAIAGFSPTYQEGVPAIAISTDELCDPGEEPGCIDLNAVHYARVAEFVVDFVAHLESKPGFLSGVSGLLPRGVGLNINYPATTQPRGVKLSAQGRTARYAATGVPGPLTFKLACYADCLGAPVGVPVPGGIFTLSVDETPDVKNGDAENYDNGYITFVPIEAVYTADNYRRFSSVIETLGF